jgi:hypothetical protein
MQVVADTPRETYWEEAEFPSEHELLRSIESKTHRQVHDLSVLCRGGRVVLRGLSRTYYVKQLATHAILDLVPNAKVENAILVSR